MDPTVDNPAGAGSADDDGADRLATELPTATPTSQRADARVYRSEPYLNTGEIPRVDDMFASAARSAGVHVAGDNPAGRGNGDGGGNGHGNAAPGEPAELHPLTDDDGGDDGHGRPGRLRGFRRRHPKLTIAVLIVMLLLLYPTGAYIGHLRKPGSESLQARTAEWARDMKLGFLVDRAEQVVFSRDQFEKGGTPDADAFKPAETAATTTPTTAAPGRATTTSTTKPAIPHIKPPTRMASPVSPPAEGEGEWSPIGPLVGGLPAAYITKVRPDTQHTSLTLFVAWIDPKLAEIQLRPGIDLPGGTGWSLPSRILPEECPKAIMATNGAFRMDQARGGYYADGKEPFKLRDGAASMVFFKDGRVDVGQWGRDFTRNDLEKISAVRQNLELMVDNGQPSPNLHNDTDWGAKLANVYFMWRSGYGITKDGALVYVGGPALTPALLAQALINAGAVRVMQGDINPEWVSANLFSVGADGKCEGAKGLDAPEPKGGMRSPANRYLATDTRDFVAVLAKQL